MALRQVRHAEWQQQRQPKQPEQPCEPRERPLRGVVLGAGPVLDGLETAHTLAFRLDFSGFTEQDFLTNLGDLRAVGRT